ncbi:hypothetical protein [Paenibacillus sacheonensis]|uniref:Cytochrome-c oxidase n=1 Tax=Paenibacillus sacheonensis TaxID=742054 RepID=A0A7X4YV22_9BACL|nr:hypothetical protein [Paenibacillus sacheonensis]MBM7569155.1 cbb3-type cytochrome oxidase subunit 1 [Paenibacillus sacheonensis]NBC72988.1 hypothetical protein [Paenibacillus sacheonensis]
MGIRFLKMAVVYIVAGICIGIYMGISLNFALTSVHTHANLLGWATLAICGLIYLRFPKAAESPLAKWHFWLHAIGLPLMLIMLTMMANDYTYEWVTILKRVGETLAGTGVFIFGINVFKNINEEEFVVPVRNGDSKEVRH